MAVCVKCGQNIKIGFFHVRDLSVGFISPLCKACHGPLVKSATQLVLRYDEHEKTAKSDPKAAAWTAVANLLCAERVNLLLETFVGISQVPLTEETWSVSRDKAIAYAEMALARVAEGSREFRFLSEIITRAKGVQGGHGEQRKKTRRLAMVGILPGGGKLFATEIEALLTGLVCLEDFDNTLGTLTGHEWLVPGHQAVEKPQSSSSEKVETASSSPPTPPLKNQPLDDKIHVQCPKCSKRMSVRKQYAGKRGKCPGCGTAIPIPS
jgi:hypothetical protein